MAEIRIEEKRGSLAWLWILLLVLIVAAAAWYMMSDRTAPVAPAPADSVGTAPSAAPSRVDSVSLPVTSSTIRMRLLSA